MTNAAMTRAHVPRPLVIDNFLPEEFVARLLDHVLSQQEAVELTDLQKTAGTRENASIRHSWRLNDALELHGKEFRAAIRQRLGEWFEPLGLGPFPACAFEMEIVAHRDGDFYRRHIDTFTAKVRETDTSDRVISTVYYFHREPKGFSGGELALYPFGGTEPALLIEPVNNRLALFPSLALHEVLPVCCPGDLFADARFAINCWIHRERGAQYPLTGS